VLAHLATDMSQYFVAVRELHTEHGIGQRLDNHAFNLDGTVFFRQGALSS